jgi:hypothetical protein
MDHAYHVLTEMVAEGAITANQRDRMALGVVVRHRRDLLAPFQNSESYRGLKVEYCQTSEHADPAWGDYERDGNLAALVNKHAGFFRATFAPTLAAPLKHHDDADARRRFSDRLEHGLRQRLTAAPEPINSLVETIVLVKTSRRLSS